MSSINLIILGLLMEKEMSAYEMVKSIEERNMGEWLKISEPTVYKNIRTLEKRGYLNARTVKEGNMPEKTVYTLNNKGREHFKGLMEHYSDKLGKFHFDFNTVIANLHKVDKKQGIEMLKKLQQQFIKRRDYFQVIMEQKKDIPITGKTILEQHNILNETLIKWIKEFKIEYSDFTG